MSGGTAWKVISQTETSQELPDGTFGPGVKVTFQLSNGTTGSVFVARSSYNKENVMEAIGEQVTKMLDVQGLTGSV